MVNAWHSAIPTVPDRFKEQTRFSKATKRQEGNDLVDGHVLNAGYNERLSTNRGGLVCYTNDDTGSILGMGRLIQGSSLPHSSMRDRKQCVRPRKPQSNCVVSKDKFPIGNYHMFALLRKKRKISKFFGS